MPPCSRAASAALAGRRTAHNRRRFAHCQWAVDVVGRQRPADHAAISCPRGRPISRWLHLLRDAQAPTGAGRATVGGWMRHANEAAAQFTFYWKRPIDVGSGRKRLKSLSGK